MKVTANSAPITRRSYEKPPERSPSKTDRVDAWLGEFHRLSAQMREEERQKLGDETVACWALVPCWPKDALAGSPLEICEDDASALGIVCDREGWCELDAQQRQQHLKDLLATRGVNFLQVQAGTLGRAFLALGSGSELLQAWGEMARAVDQPDRTFVVLHRVASQPGNPKAWLELVRSLEPLVPGLSKEIGRAWDDYRQRSRVPTTLLMDPHS